ncbi:MAG: ParA family protein [Deltaproteobacteria bacterium]|nr:ParA family protein [Deltaproteobacteria bacterium]MBM4286107.1 ParA family protein [Deltaproteobacteria bacterium]
MSTVVAIINQKGGTGKTTTAINLSAGLAYQGYRTLVVDLDPQGHTTIGLGVEPDSFQECMAEVLSVPRKRIAEVIVATYIPGLYLAPSHIRLARAAEQCYTRVFREMILAQSLEGLEFDFVLIDCPPSLGVLTTNSLFSCSFIIIPCQISRYSLDGLADLLTTVETVKNLSPEELFEQDLFRILLTTYDRRNRVTNEYILEQLKPYRDKTFATFIMKNEALNQAQIAQKAIFDYDPRSSGAHDYRQLTTEFLEICQRKNNLPGKRPSWQSFL